MRLWNRKLHHRALYMFPPGPFLSQLIQLFLLTFVLIFFSHLYPGLRGCSLHWSLLVGKESFRSFHESETHDAHDRRRLGFNAGTSIECIPRFLEVPRFKWFCLDKTHDVGKEVRSLPRSHFRVVTYLHYNHSGQMVATGIRYVIQICFTLVRFT